MSPDQIKAIRLALHMTQAGLGRELGCHRNTIAAWEHGKWPINTAAARLLPHLLRDEQEVQP